MFHQQGAQVHVAVEDSQHSDELLIISSFNSQHLEKLSIFLLINHNPFITFLLVILILISVP